MIKQAAEKLMSEAEAFKGNKSLLSPVYSYLLSILNDELAGLVLQEGYTLDEMVKFIIEKARTALEGKNGALADDVVYGFATDYYHASRDEIDKLLHKIKKTDKPETTKQAKPAEVKKPEAKKPEPKKKENEQKEREQLSLFDLMGGYANA